ncbi:uncharacterized protein LOC118826454 isoform X1 [Colossoma macropomum]|uniref:uncharacterized protein LOC118826454 isoform X1 n=1 Tax=Colossoma macropomum TaxID=42526 RepID=UPI0018642A7A|nr:uncharacterized protein LOC118826454 isoform X1 [Colossoma macropomum]
MLFFVSVCVLVVHALSSLLHLVVIRWESIKQMQCVYELQRGFSMGALTVLGLQLCLLTFSLGAPYFPVWSVSDTESQDELKSMDQPIMFETGYGELHQAEAPELGLEMKYQDPQDYDITLMKHRVRRSEKKKKKKFRAGAFTLLGSFQQTSLDGIKTPVSSRTKREAEAAAGKLLHPRPKPHQGKMSPIGNTGEPEVVRAKRQLQKKKKPSKQPSRPGRNSLVGSMGPTVSSIQE